MSKRYIYYGSTTSVPSFVNTKSVLFDGVNEYVNIAGSTADYSFIQNTDVFSISMWFKLVDYTADALVSFAGNNSGTTNQKGFILYIENRSSQGSPNNIIFLSTRAVAGQRVAQIITPNNAITDNNWHHLAVTSNDTTGNIYIDGSSVSLATDTHSTNSTGNSTQNLQFATLGNAVLPSNLYQDEITIYNAELTSGEVTTLYNGGCPAEPSTTNLVSYWKMGDGDTFPTLIDTQGGKNGTMTNMEAGDIVTDTPC